jgi:hypothetical protein
MFVKVMAGALLASAICFGSAQAQSVSDIGGPRELPPASFKGQQYVDSRGCVFLRAGLGGTVNWVPRVGRDRRAMCGYPPSFGSGGGTAVARVEPPAAPAPKPAPQPIVRAATEPPPSSYVPAPVQGVQVAQAPVRMAPRVAAQPMVTVAAPVVPSTPSFSATKIGCTRAAPVPQRLRLTNGGTVVVCTRGDGSLEGLVAPIYPAGSGVGASLSPANRNVPLGQPSAIGNATAEPRVATQTVRVPEGYKLAWEDDRLNPLRGVGTAEGQAMQDQVWTRDVPAQPVAAAPARRVVLSSQSAPTVTVSTKSAPAAAQGGRVFVQVGSFGQPANADGASARLAALGLPVARSKGQIKGKAVQVVLAGPFGSAAEAQAALRAARGAGFGDAFIR